MLSKTNKDVCPINNAIMPYLVVRRSQKRPLIITAANKIHTYILDAIGNPLIIKNILREAGFDTQQNNIHRFV